MIAVAGLGNPEEGYTQTRHNLGFLILDQLAAKQALDWESKPSLKSLVSKDSEYILLKPLTYVNLSGESISLIVSYFKLDVSNIWVVQDDTEIPFGEVRVKQGGTSGGHNGIKSIDEAVGANYWRIRVGVGRPANSQYDLADYVLEEFNTEERGLLPTVIDRVTDFLVQSIKDQQLKTITFNAKEK